MTVTGFQTAHAHVVMYWDYRNAITVSEENIWRLILLSLLPYTPITALLGNNKKKRKQTLLFFTHLFKVTTVSYIMCAWLVDIHSTYSYYRFVFEVSFCEVTDCLWEWHCLNETKREKNTFLEEHFLTSRATVWQQVVHHQKHRSNRCLHWPANKNST